MNEPIITERSLPGWDRPICDNVAYLCGPYPAQFRPLVISGAVLIALGVIIGALSLHPQKSSKSFAKTGAWLFILGGLALIGVAVWQLYQLHQV